jgi:hypothetical protein
MRRDLYAQNSVSREMQIGMMSLDLCEFCDFIQSLNRSDKVLESDRSSDPFPVANQPPSDQETRVFLGVI